MKKTSGGDLSSPKGSKRPAFVVPDLSEIRCYCAEHHYDIDPEEFFAYYSSNGWYVGRTPMRDWHSALVTWAKRSKRKSNPLASEKGCGTAHYRTPPTSSSRLEESRLVPKNPEDFNALVADYERKFLTKHD